MRGGELGLGLPPKKQGDPTLALSLPFTSGTLPSIFTQERTGLGGSWDATGSALGFGPHNLLVRSNKFDTSWTKALTTLTEIADHPSATTTGWRFQDNSSAGTGVPFLAQSFTLMSGQKYTWAIRAKADQLNFLRLSPSLYDASANTITYFNLATGAVHSTTSDAAGMIDDGEGWYICWMEFTTVTDLSGNVAVYMSEDGSSVSVDIDGSSSILIAGAHFAPGSIQDYIETTTAARYLLRHPKHPLLSERGVLGEGQRTNEFSFCDDYSNAAWAKSNVTVTSDAVASPMAGVMADKVEATATASTFILRAATVVGTAASYSCFVKKGSSATAANDFRLRNETTATDLVRFTMNYDTGTPTITIGTTSNISIIDVGSGWWQVSMFTASGITSGNSVRAYSCFPAASATAGDFAYLWASQFEFAEYPSSLIVTGSTTATRTTDPRLTYALPAALQTQLATAGTLYVEFAFVGAGSAANSAGRGIAALYSDTSNYIYLYNRSAKLGFQVKYGGSEIAAAPTVAAADAYEVVRLAVSWDATRVRLTYNGATVGTTGSYNYSITTLELLGAFGDATLGGIIHDANVYTRYMEDAEREALAHA